MFYKKGTGEYRQLLEGAQMKTMVHGDKTLMGKFKIAEGAEIPTHSHPHEQTGLLLSGKLRLKVEEEIVAAKAGDNWCIRGGVEHSAEALEDSVIVEVFSPVRDDYLPEVLT